jgi:hypothetical protein
MIVLDEDHQFYANGFRVMAVVFSGLAVNLSFIPDGPEHTVQIQKWMIGLVAAVPGVMAFAAQTLKYQQRSNWECRKADYLRGLQRKLLFEVPESPTVENVGSIAAEYDRIEKDMDSEYEKLMGKDLRVVEVATRLSH